MVKQSIKAITVLLVVVCLAAAGLVLAQAAVPKLIGRVNDYAGMLDQRQQTQLDDGLRQFEEQTTTQVVLLTVPSLEGESIDTFSIRVAEKWKIGQAGKDNGVILVVAPTERKVRIEVGYGLEGALTDLEASRIIRSVITPAFKTGNFYAGIAGGLDGIMKATQGEFKAPEGSGLSQGNRKKSSALSTILSLIVLVALLSTRLGRGILFFSLLSGGRGGRGGFGGGGFSGGGGGFGGGGASGGW